MAQEPSRSWLLDYLPAIFHQDGGESEPQISYLGLFLKPFGDVLLGFEELLSIIDSYFAPETTPADWVPWLAEWLALDLDENWDTIKHRQLLGKAMELHRRRGTISGLKRFIEIYNRELAVTIGEGRRRSGMQIGVASRIGGFISADKKSRPDPLSVTGSITSIEHQVLSEATFGLYIFKARADTIPFLEQFVDRAKMQGEEIVQLTLRTDQVKRLTVQGEKPNYEVEVELRTPFSAKVVTRVHGRDEDQYYIQRGTGQFIEPDVGDALLIIDCFADQVEQVTIKEMEPEDAARRYEVELLHRKDGIIQFDATDIARVDGFVDDCYRFKFSCKDETGRDVECSVDFVGDTFLIDEVEAPYSFTVDIAVPEKDWDTVVRPEGLRAISRIVEDMKPVHTTHSLTLTRQVAIPRIQTMQIGVQSEIGDETIAIG